MAQTDLQKLVVTLEAQNTAYIRKLEQSEKRADRWQKKTSRATSKVKGAFLALGAALSVRALARMINETAKAIDEQVKMADALGITTREMAGLELAARINGVELGKLTSGVTRFTKSMSDAQDGLTTPIRALERLGITIEDLEQLSTFDQISVIADKFQGLENHIDKTSVSLNLFGRSGLNFTKILEGGSQGLADFVLETDMLGSSISRVDGEKVEAANDAMLRMGDAGKGLAKTLTVELAPAMETIAGWMTALASKEGGIRGFFAGIQNLAQSVAATVNGAALGDLPRLVNELAAATERLADVKSGRSFLFDFSEADAQAEVDRLQDLIDLTVELRAARSAQGPTTPADRTVTGGGGTSTADLVETGLEGIESNLRQQIALYGQVGEAARLAYLMANGLAQDITETDIERVTVLEDQLQALKDAETLQETLADQMDDRTAAQKAALEEVEGFRLMTMTEEQQRAEELLDIYQQLQNAVALGVIDQPEANTVFSGIEEQIKNAESELDTFSAFADEAARNSQGLLAEFFTDSDAGNLKQRFGAMIADLIAQTAASGLLDWFTGLGKGGGKGEASSGITGLLGKFAGFFDSGGDIPEGQFGIAAEKRQEFINTGGGLLLAGPASVTSGAETARMLSSKTEDNRSSVSIGQITMSFPGINSAGEAKVAASTAARELQSKLNNIQRYG